jgi:hypothetical protein
MVTGQAKMDLISRSALPISEQAAAKTDAELIGYIQQSFAEKNSALLQLERHHQQQSQVIERLQSESSTLLAELFKTQELLEEAHRKNEYVAAQTTRLSSRIDKLKTHLPNHWEVDVVALKRTKKGSVEILQWSLENVYLGDELIPSIQLETHLKQKEVGVVLKQQPSLSEGHWLVSAHSSNGNQIRIFATNGAAGDKENAEISALGTTDWKKIKALIYQLAQFVKTESDKDARFRKADTAALHIGLLALHQKLSNWPWVFRFDQVKLKDTLQTSEYQRLSLSLINFSVGNYEWPKLEYSLATVDHAGGFGQNPRLEFPEASKEVIKNWFAETSDGRGSRLELRFAMPNAFDWTVWRKLTGEDQLLITVLISSLPLQIAAIEKLANHAQDLEKWKMLSHHIKVILARQLNQAEQVG